VAVTDAVTLVVVANDELFREVLLNDACIALAGPLAENACTGGTISHRQDCPRQITGNRGAPMPTSSQEYRRLADECLEGVNEAKEWYVRMALLRLASEFEKRAENLEHRRAA
jgi:hypothetical protein